MSEKMNTRNEEKLEEAFSNLWEIYNALWDRCNEREILGDLYDALVDAEMLAFYGATDEEDEDAE